METQRSQPQGPCETGETYTEVWVMFVNWFLSPYPGYISDFKLLNKHIISGQHYGK